MILGYAQAFTVHLGPQVNRKILWLAGPDFSPKNAILCVTLTSHMSLWRYWYVQFNRNPCNQYSVTHILGLVNFPCQGAGV